MRRTVTAVAVVVGFATAAAAGMDAVDYDVWRYGEYRTTLAAEAGYAADLDRRLDVTGERLALKDAAVNDFLDRRATFADVVERFRAANATNDQVAAAVRARFPAADDREVAARNAYDFIAARAAADPARQALLPGLRAEIDRTFARPAAG